MVFLRPPLLQRNVVKLPRGGAEALLVLGTFLFLLVGALIAEFCVRAFSDINFLGNSENLFVADAFGTSMGNAPNVRGISFGAVVYTDEHGFRVPEGGLPADEGKATAILILGDSVGFGPAVEEGDTYAGRLRAHFPTKKVYNASVIGYATRDYRNVVAAFVPHHDEVTEVVLVFCLNDVTSRSAVRIARHLEAKRKMGPREELRERLRSVSLFSAANGFLRSHSKLYLHVKHRLFGTQNLGWEVVSPLYGSEREADLKASLEDIAWIANTLRERGISFVVVLSPFSYQLENPRDPCGDGREDRRRTPLLRGAPDDGVLPALRPDALFEGGPPGDGDRHRRGPRPLRLSLALRV
jgi:hypothetical protein